MHRSPEGYERYKARARQQRRENRAKARQMIADAKASGCVECGRTDRLLDLHHTDPATKTFNIGLWRKATSSLAVLQAELDKCVPVCHAECHALVMTREG